NLFKIPMVVMMSVATVIHVLMMVVIVMPSVVMMIVMFVIHVLIMVVMAVMVMPSVVMMIVMVVMVLFILTHSIPLLNLLDTHIGQTHSRMPQHPMPFSFSLLKCSLILQYHFDLKARWLTYLRLLPRLSYYKYELTYLK